MHSVELSDLIKGVDGGRQSAVETENLVRNDCCEGQVVEEFREVLPDIGIAVLAQTFVIETVNLRVEG